MCYKQMRITVSISCYNQEDKITDCIESVMAQDYNDVEIIVVDDCSTDKSVDVINGVFAAHPEVSTRLIVHDTNKGLSFVRNTGIQEASGDAIIFVDGDDTMVENSLGLFCKKMKETNADVVCGSFRTIDEQGNVLREYKYPTAYTEGNYAFSMYIENYLMDKRWIPIDVWNKLYKLDWLRTNNIHCSTKYKFNEGFYFTFLVTLNANRMYVLSDITYNWLQISTSESHRELSPDRINTLIASMDAVFALFIEYKKTHDVKSIPQGIYYLFNFYWLTSGFIRQVVFSKLCKTEKLLYINTIKEKYRGNRIKWNQVRGVYNRMSYLILFSPFPYTLFKWYFRHLKTIIRMVNTIFINKNSEERINTATIHH